MNARTTNAHRTGYVSLRQLPFARKAGGTRAPLVHRASQIPNNERFQFAPIGRSARSCVSHVVRAAGGGRPRSPGRVAPHAGQAAPLEAEAAPPQGPPSQYFRSHQPTTVTLTQIVCFDFEFEYSRLVSRSACAFRNGRLAFSTFFFQLQFCSFAIVRDYYSICIN